MALQRLAGNAAVSRLAVQRDETSFPEDAEAQLTGQGGSPEAVEGEEAPVQTQLQRCSAETADAGEPAMEGQTSSETRLQRSPTGAVSPTPVVQRVGGAKAGELCIRSNAISDGLTAGHAWLSYTPTGGSEKTWGTWGNLSPKGLYRDREVGRSFKASRGADVDAADYAAVESFATANNAWSYTNNCASFAARGWASVIGESIDHTTLGIPNPSALGAGISTKNGGSPIGKKGGVPPAGGGGGSGDSSL